jgi:acylphosphatase
MAVHLIITGTVQGVGFREYMRREAESLGVKGWVRNRREGSVEALVQGDPDAVRKLIEWAHRGPRAARVSGVKAVGVDDAEAGTEFSILPPG